MRDQDVTKARQPEIRQDHLPGHTVAAVDDIGAVAHDDRLRRSGPGAFRCGPSRGAEEVSRVPLRAGCPGAVNASRAPTRCEMNRRRLTVTSARSYPTVPRPDQRSSSAVRASPELRRSGVSRLRRRQSPPWRRRSCRRVVFKRSASCPKAPADLPEMPIFFLQVLFLLLEFLNRLLAVFEIVDVSGLHGLPARSAARQSKKGAARPGRTGVSPAQGGVSDQR